MIVKATGKAQTQATTFDGYVIDTLVNFVFLPSVSAMGRTILIRNATYTSWEFAVVLGVGPWNTHDDAYVFTGERPQAESGVSSYGIITDGAGIDIGLTLWNTLGVEDLGDVEWKFADPNVGNLKESKKSTSHSKRSLSSRT